jgi:transposase-like protein
MQPLAKKSRRRYSDREKATALALYDATGTLTEVANACGIPDSTLCDWIKGNRGVSSPDVSIMRSGYELKPLDLADRFDEIAHRATGEVVGRLRNSKQAEKISMPHLIRAAEISVDKSQLLRAQPTQITESLERLDLVMILQGALQAAVIDIEAEPVIDATPAAIRQRSCEMKSLVRHSLLYESSSPLSRKRFRIQRGSRRRSRMAYT